MDLDKTSVLSLVQSVYIELNLILTDSIVKMHELCGYRLLFTDALLSLYLCVKEGFLNIVEEICCQAMLICSHLENIISW